MSNREMDKFRGEHEDIPPEAQEEAMQKVNFLKNEVDKAYHNLETFRLPPENTQYLYKVFDNTVKNAWFEIGTNPYYVPPETVLARLKEQAEALLRVINENTPEDEQLSAQENSTIN